MLPHSIRACRLCVRICPPSLELLVFRQKPLLQAKFLVFWGCLEVFVEIGLLLGGRQSTG